MNDAISGLPDISIRQLEYLVAVADAPTWATAADRVGVSASALSQGLAELERRVGVELFESVGRRRILRTTVTPVLEHARQVLALTRDVSTWAERLRTAQSGRVRLGMIDVAAVVHFPDVLRAFRAERADVEFMLSVASSRSLLNDVQRGALDLAVCVEPPEPIAGVDTTSLLSEPMIVYGPPNSMIGTPQSWGPWVLFPSDSHTRRLVVERLRALGAPVTIAAESHQPDVLREMVLLGLGWTVLPRSQGESERGAMTVGDQILERKLVLARRSGAVTDPAVDELARRLRRRPISN
ncbi:LysR family transcriptional regulator [uncultured Ilumatobacter sp.]|uniref:LysR family transcriptional regulator n=1 Tax=uncultured Ilumatobacter sp. TaxID=879968 RepID=UPI00374FA848